MAMDGMKKCFWLVLCHQRQQQTIVSQKTKHSSGREGGDRGGGEGGGRKTRKKKIYIYIYLYGKKQQQITELKLIEFTVKRRPMDNDNWPRTTGKK